MIEKKLYFELKSKRKREEEDLLDLMVLHVARNLWQQTKAFDDNTVEVKSLFQKAGWKKRVL